MYFKKSNAGKDIGEQWRIAAEEDAKTRGMYKITRSDGKTVLRESIHYLKDGTLFVQESMAQGGVLQKYADVNSIIKIEWVPPFSDCEEIAARKQREAVEQQIKDGEYTQAE